MKRALFALFAAMALQPALAADPLVDRGRYVVGIAGCNDCHTPGFAMKGGQVAEKEWLTGDGLGWRGPWGTTYATNLRLYIPTLTEDAWLKKAKSLSTRPPMPWFNLHRMADDDLRAIYRYIVHLGPAGKPAPAYVPPEQTPAGPYVQFP